VADGDLEELPSRRVIVIRRCSIFRRGENGSVAGLEDRGLLAELFLVEGDTLSRGVRDEIRRGTMEPRPFFMVIEPSLVVGSGIDNRHRDRPR